MDESRRKPLLDFLLSLLTLGFYDCWLLYAIPSDFSKAEGKKAIGSEEKAGNETKNSTEEKAENGGRLSGRLIAAALKDGCAEAERVIDTYATYLMITFWSLMM